MITVEVEVLSRRDSQHVRVRKEDTLQKLLQESARAHNIDGGGALRILANNKYLRPRPPAYPAPRPDPALRPTSTSRIRRGTSIR